MEAMDGPINFGDRDKWWGLLTKGFDLEPNYQCNYHMPYYQTLFENYGFQNYFNQFTFRRKITDPLNHRLKYKAELIAKDPDYTFEHLNDYMLKKQTLDIIEIYNKAWKDHKGVSQLTQCNVFQSTQACRRYCGCCCYCCCRPDLCIDVGQTSRA